jgi:hypothetical protein
MCTFNSYWKWLCAKERKFRTLGGKSAFTVVGGKQILISSTGRKYGFNTEQAQGIWERFIELLDVNQQDAAKNYVDPQWQSIAGRNLSPWLASTIREFCQEYHCLGF